MRPSGERQISVELVWSTECSYQGTELAAPHVHAVFVVRGAALQKGATSATPDLVALRKAGSFFFPITATQPIFSISKPCSPSLKHQCLTPKISLLRVSSFCLLYQNNQIFTFFSMCVLKTCLPYYNPEWGILRTI